MLTWGCFPLRRAEKALVKTNRRGLEAAMEWLLAHQDDADIDEPLPAAAEGHTLAGAADGSCRFHSVSWAAGTTSPL